MKLYRKELFDLLFDLFTRKNFATIEISPPVFLFPSKLFLNLTLNIGVVKVY
jgi:hypothetical protein